MDKWDTRLAGWVTERVKTLFTSKAALAKLRRGVGKLIGQRPDILAYVLIPDTWEDYNNRLQSAAYTALTLYALHQQGKSELMHDSAKKDEDGKSIPGNSLGTALRLLKTADTEEALTRRFNQVMTAKDLTELSFHARNLIGQLRKQDIRLDYGRLARDLYWFQIPNARRNVLLSWGRDFYQYQKEQEE